MTRINVSVKTELFKEIVRFTESRGKSVSSFFSEAANLYLESDKNSFKPEDIVKSFETLEILKEINAVPVPSLLLDGMIKYSVKCSNKEVMEKWYERGQIIGDILKKRAKNLQEFAVLLEEYKFMLPTDMFDIEFDDDTVTVVISGVGYSTEAASCTSEGLNGMLQSYGYDSEKVEVSEGFVKVIGRKSTHEVVKTIS
ncbi:MAG: hypothetical protein M1393_00125 [Candidatus Thermoplasmatota archaeon]|jgi:hypothetical protein|nr:hypothetical protein [Candidatus Thermoplasmatota archaeon]MCL6089433.1 hypothetical protein [Candidatus Thermoplasmatota archaeon]